MAINHFGLKVLRKCFIGWQSWTKEQQRLREIKHQKEVNAMRMAAFLDAAASGKLWSGNDAEQPTRTERSSVEPSSQRENFDSKIVWLDIFVLTFICTLAFTREFVSILIYYFKCLPCFFILLTAFIGLFHFTFPFVCLVILFIFPDSYSVMYDLCIVLCSKS